MRGRIARKGAGLTALVLGITVAAPAMAELRVIESNVPAYKVGDMLPNNTVFNLNAGDRVQLLVLPSNATKVFEGKGSFAYEPRGGSRGVKGKKAEETEPGK
jgi:hypothetical protein